MNRFALLLLLLFSPLLSVSYASPVVVEEPKSATESVPNNDVTFYVARHSKTMFNTFGRAQGWSDTPLTPEGIEIAENLARGLKDIDFVAVYSSDFGRARETAQIILAERDEKQPLIESQSFREVCFGIFEGDYVTNLWNAAADELNYTGYIGDEAGKVLIKDMQSNKIGAKPVLDAIAAADTSGFAEDFDTVQARFMQKLHQIGQDVSAQGGGNILIVSHSAAIRVLLNSIPNASIYSESVKNCSISKVVYRNGQFYLDEKPNDLSYVERGATLKSNAQNFSQSSNPAQQKYIPNFAWHNYHGTN